MAENARPPVAVRIVRPYETEEAFLESELETVGKTSVILIGAHSRPTGVILRFEVTLASGTTVLRGEGRVLAHKENAFRGQPGLALRFTRLDPKSKALVDRAAAIREARLANESRPASAPPPAAPQPPPVAPSPPPQAVQRQSAAPPDPRENPRPSQGRSMSRPSAPPTSMPAPDPVLAEILGAPTPPPPELKRRARRSVPPPEEAPREPAPEVAAREHAGDVEEPGARRSERPTSAPERSSTAPPGEPLPADEPSRPQASTLVDEGELGATETKHDVHGSATVSAPAMHAATVAAPPPPASGPPGRALSAPPDREGLLARLRQRAAALTEEQVAAIVRVRPDRS